MTVISFVCPKLSWSPCISWFNFDPKKYLVWAIPPHLKIHFRDFHSHWKVTNSRCDAIFLLDESVEKYWNSSSASKASSVQIMYLKWSSLLVLTTILVGSQAFQSLMDLETDSRLLSRQRRFLIPNVTSDWTFTVRFSLAFPLEGLDTSFDGNVPFSMKFNLNR